MEDKTPTEQVEIDIGRLNSKLGDFEKSVGLLDFLKKETVEKAQELLNTDWYEYKQLNKSAEDVLIDSIILTDYAGSVQRLINQQRSLIIWSKERIKKQIGHVMAPLKGIFSYEERECVALKNNSFAEQLNYKKVEAELYLSRIETVYYTIKNLADRLEKLAEIKSHAKS